MIGARAKVDVNVGERRAKKVAVCIELLSASSCWSYVRWSTWLQSNSMRNLANGVKSSRGCVLTCQEEGRDIDVTLGKVNRVAHGSHFSSIFASFFNLIFPRKIRSKMMQKWMEDEK